MCLLIVNSKDTVFSEKFLKGVYDRNEDGLGIMYAEDGVLHVKRCLPDNAKEAIKFYRTHAEGRDCVTHWRMRTHGDINLANCHPYEVFGDGSDMPIYMAHNGVLSTGNFKDTSLSDTWHYIEDYIRPLVKANPAMVFDEAFIKLISAHIGGGNKFAFMNHLGDIAVCNKSAFITYEGSLLSNTYAWDYYGLHPNVPRQSSFGTYRQKTWNNRSTAWESYYSAPKKTEPLKTVKKPTIGNQIQELMDRIEFISPDVGESLLFTDMARCLKKVSYEDVADLIEMLEYGYCAESEFREAILKPETLMATLNACIKAEATQSLCDDLRGDLK
jgi:hypothetical protein